MGHNPKVITLLKTGLTAYIKYIIQEELKHVISQIKIWFESKSHILAVTMLFLSLMHCMLVNYFNLSVTCEFESVRLPINHKSMVFERGLLPVQIYHQATDVIP